MRRRRGGTIAREEAVDALELRPLMNVFIVLIPMLLMSAVFVEIRVIEMSPSPVAASGAASEHHDYDLALVIHDGAYVIEGDGVVLGSVARTTGGDGPTADAAAQLTRVLADVVAAHPELQDVRIVSGPSVHYQELVALMDLARATGLTQTALEAAALRGA